MSDEKEDYTNLVKSPGWQRLQAWAQRELKAQMEQHIENVANQADDARALAQLRQVIVARNMVDRVLAHPEEHLKRIAQLEAQAPPSLARGGV